MTPNQRFLLSAAKDALSYFDRREKGHPPLGMYEDITVARTLSEAIKVFEAEQRVEVSVLEFEARR